MFAIELKSISKRFGTLRANDNVTVSISQGEIHALVGENGAGKSTLMKILYGMHRPDQGTIFINGRQEPIGNPTKAISLGIGMVHQHFMLIPPLTVTENVILGREMRPMFSFLNARKMERSISTLSQQYRLAVDPTARIESLSVGLQQRVEILKIIHRNANIIILDEPTPVLTPQEIEDLFTTLRQMKSEGKTVILITHKLSEVMSISDTVTVMRRGKVEGSLETKSTTPSEISRLMVGREIHFVASTTPSPPSTSMLTVHNISAASDRRLPVVRNISFGVARGEILGIAAVEGNGQSELVEVLTGLRPPTTGTITIDGKHLKFASTEIAHIPEDRISRGLILDFNLKDNLLLGRQRERRFFGTFSRHGRAVQDFTKSLISEYDVRPPDPEQFARALSGGNQQKLVLARELSKNARVIVASQPTRGLDISAIEFVHRTLLGQRDKGKAILLVSSDLEELLRLSDRIAVMYEGQIVSIVDAKHTSERELGLFMTGSRKKSA